MVDDRNGNGNGNGQDQPEPPSEPPPEPPEELPPDWEEAGYPGPDVTTETTPDETRSAQ